MKSACKIAILLVCGLPAFGGTIVYTDLTSFASATGPNSIANFDDVAAGTSSPFTSDGVGFSNATVEDDAVSLGDSFWFGGQGSAPNWASTDSANGPMTLTFPSDVVAFGFLFTCFACDAISNNAGMQWTMLSASDSIVGSGTTTYNFDTATGFSYASPYFLGVESTVPFQSVTVERTDIDTGLADGGVWFVDDVRDAAATPEPSTAVYFALCIVWMAIRFRAHTVRRG
jgi:hypothetical protein